MKTKLHYPQYLYVRIKFIEQELDHLKQFLAPTQTKTTKIEGLWKGAEISETEIYEAKRAPFKTADPF